jgi:hypothetical protein
LPPEKYPDCCGEFLVMDKTDGNYKRELVMGRRPLRKTYLGDIGASLDFMVGRRDGAGGAEKRQCKMGVEDGELGVGV